MNVHWSSVTVTSMIKYIGNRAVKEITAGDADTEETRYKLA